VQTEAAGAGVVVVVASAALEVVEEVGVGGGDSVIGVAAGEVVSTMVEDELSGTEEDVSMVEEGVSVVEEGVSVVEGGVSIVEDGPSLVEVSLTGADLNVEEDDSPDGGMLPVEEMLVLGVEDAASNVVSSRLEEMSVVEVSNAAVDESSAFELAAVVNKDELFVGLVSTSIEVTLGVVRVLMVLKIDSELLVKLNVDDNSGKTVVDDFTGGTIVDDGDIVDDVVVGADNDDALCVLITIEMPDESLIGRLVSRLITMLILEIVGIVEEFNKGYSTLLGRNTLLDPEFVLMLDVPVLAELEPAVLILELVCTFGVIDGKGTVDNEGAVENKELVVTARIVDVKRVVEDDGLVGVEEYEGPVDDGEVIGADELVEDPDATGLKMTVAKISTKEILRLCASNRRKGSHREVLSS
jgi:hypothetical protein